MPKNDNAHAIRFAESLQKNADEQAAEDFANSHPLSKSADIYKKFEWAMRVCSFLEKNYSEEKIKSIRKDCRCNDGKSIADKLIKYLNKADSIRSFVELFNRNESFAELEYVSENKILFCYPECYCSCVKRVPKEISMTWCYCTEGNAQCIFNEVFKKEVSVKLIKSIKTGADKCVIEVEWQNT